MAVLLVSRYGCAAWQVVWPFCLAGGVTVLSGRWCDRAIWQLVWPCCLAAGMTGIFVSEYGYNAWPREKLRVQGRQRYPGCPLRAKGYYSFYWILGTKRLLLPFTRVVCGGEGGEGQVERSGGWVLTGLQGQAAAPRCGKRPVACRPPLRQHFRGARRCPPHPALRDLLRPRRSVPLPLSLSPTSVWYRTRVKNLFLRTV